MQLTPLNAALCSTLCSAMPEAFKLILLLRVTGKCAGLDGMLSEFKKEAYSIVPMKLFVRTSSVMFPLASPKSVTLTCPLESNKTFSCTVCVSAI